MDITWDGPTLVLAGHFDVRSTWEVRTAIYETLDEGDDVVVIDMSGVEGIDVTALRLLAVATRHASRSGHHLRLRDCSPAVRRMMHLSRLAHLFEMDAPSQVRLA